ncbi:MAG: peptidoglycan DD-metalloendopeptidase family protein [Chloroflexota bacterium]
MRKAYLLFILLLLGLPTTPLTAQDDTAAIPQVHTVQEGENLTVIAEQYGITVADLLLVNNLTDGDVLFVGQELIIPGGTGDATATVYAVQAGDSWESIAASFNTTAVSVLQSNRLINQQTQPYVGQTLSIISRTGSPAPQLILGQPIIAQAGEGPLAVAVRANMAPAVLLADNRLAYPAYLIPGQRLRAFGEQNYRDLPNEWIDVDIRPLPLVPGRTAVIHVKNLLDGQPTGQIGAMQLQFSPTETGHSAIFGLDAFTTPEQVSLELSGSGSRPWPRFQQDVQIRASDFVTQFITLPDTLNALLDPNVRQNEEAILAPIFSQYTPERQWTELFQTPIITNTAVTARYGDGRSYNNNPVTSYHSGVDYGASQGVPVQAAANGTVVFSDFLNVRGLTVIVDHGIGVMTSYSHLSESFATVGQTVTAGTPLGAVGSTGLSSGPHLHWELRIMNMPVNALQWLEEPFP